MRLPVRAALCLAACSALFHLSVAGTTNATCGSEPPIQLEDGKKRHYVTGVLAIRGEERAFEEWNKTFNAYLTQAAGPRFDPPITFSMEALNFITLYTAIQDGRLDFIFVNPSAFSCMESEYAASSLVSLRNIRTVGEDKFITTEFGGVIFTRADRDDLQKLEDIKDRSFAAASISGLGSGQAQFRVLRQKGLDYLNDPVQAVFTSNQGLVVTMVENGEVDFGFVRTDQIEGRVSRGLNQMETFKFIEAEYKMSGGEQFPFPLTTSLYPEWNVGALPHVDPRVQRMVQEALQAVPAEHEAAQAGGYFGWQPTTSYMTLRDMQTELGVIQLDPADLKMKCVRSTTLYDSIICPPGYYKKSEAEVAGGCGQLGRSCPDGMQCICRACERGFAVDVFEASSPDQRGCGKMSVCGSTRQRSPVSFRVIDRLERRDAEVSYFLHVGDGLSAPATSTGNHSYVVELAVDTVGVHVLELFFNGEQISESPMLVEVTPRDCKTEFGKAALREPDELGECICEGQAVEVGGKCVEVWVLAISIALPLLALLLCAGCVYAWHRRNKSEAYWRVKFADLEFGSPPEVLGRGTFGLVLKGEYRGTTVAVKKVLPPKSTKDGNLTAGSGRMGQDGTGSITATNVTFPWSSSQSVAGASAVGRNDSAERRFESGLPGVTEEPEGGEEASRGPQLDGAGTFPGSLLDGTSTFPGSGSPPRSPISPRSPLSRPTMLPSILSGANGNGSGRHLQKRASFSNQIQEAEGEMTILPENDELEENRIDPFAAWRTRTPGSILWRSSPQNSFMVARGGSGSADGSAHKFGVCSRLLLCTGLRTDRLHEDFLHEMAVIARLRHPCITTVMGAVVEKGREPLLIMELMEHGSLYDLLRNSTLEIDGEIILPIVRDVAQGMNFLHQAKPAIIHGDIKSQNVLVDMRFRAKVSDFGLTQKKKVGLHGTPYFMAPELLQGEEITPAADVFAFAILMCEVYSRREPYEGEDPRDVLAAVKDTSLVPPKRCTLPDSAPQALRDMIQRCWDNDKEQRLSFQEIDARMRTMDASNLNPLYTIRSKQKSTNRLLYDVFPKHIADALAEGKKVEPESREVVTIFFSDIVGFTNISATVPPEKVSNMLDRLYTTFDALSREHGVFKVETIGDAYMAVTNLVENQVEDHAVRIARFALAAVKAAKETAIDLDDPAKGVVNIRVGFHSGPVVANVVGTRNPRYCLFGDTVNTASRMESNSIKNRIHMSQSAARCVRQQDRTLVIASRGWIQVKGKGDMKTYWLLGESGGRRRELSQEGLQGRTHSGASRSSREDLRTPSGDESSGTHIDWNGETFMRAPSLEAVHMSMDCPRVPDMAVPNTIEEDAEDAAREPAAELTEGQRLRRRSLENGGGVDMRTGSAHLVTGDVVVDGKVGEIHIAET